MYRKTHHLLLAVLISTPLIASAETPAPTSTVPALTANAELKVFQSPDEAAKALLEALSQTDSQQLSALFGNQQAELLSSGDDVEDQNNRQTFLNLAREKSVCEKIGEDRAILHVGNTDWPFPIPLIKQAEHWRFDAEQGRQEILNRRIGRNELNTLATIRGYMEAQFEYASADRDGDGVLEYAQKLHSEPSKFDGLFWESAEGQPQSPLGPLIAEARADGYKIDGTRTPYHGYYYRILTRQGSNAPGGKYDYIINGNMIAGFGLIAFPVNYGVSGIMTFVVNHQGKIYQKDLGSKTAQSVEKIKEYNPDSTWQAFTE